MVDRFIQTSHSCVGSDLMPEIASCFSWLPADMNSMSVGVT